MKQAKIFKQSVTQKNRRVAYGAVTIGKRAMELITQVVDSTRVSTGPNVQAFEQAFANIVGSKYAVAVSSGTDACLVMMASLLDKGAERGDEVIVPALTFSSTANAILMAGLSPKFVDIDRETLNIDPTKIEAAITPKTRAIFAVHLMGKPAPLDELRAIAQKHGLFIYEDACEAHGTEYKGKRVGGDSIGAAFSLYAAHLICTGEGGMVTTNDASMVDLYWSLRSHGRPPGELTFDFQRVGFNSKMNELEAALGLAAADMYEEILAIRKANLDFYNTQIRMLPWASEWLWVQTEEEYELIGPQGFPIVIKENAPFTLNELTAALKDAGIEWKLLFGSLPTQHRAWKFLQHQLGEFPAAEYVGTHGLHIGIHDQLTNMEKCYVVDTVRKFLERY